MKSKLSPAWIVAIVAVFFALGGGAYAASGIANGSVTHGKLANNSVWHNNLGTGVVQSSNVSPNLLAEFGKSGIPGPAGTNGANGAAGPQGPVGPAGPAGTAGNSPTTALSFAAQDSTAATAIYTGDGITIFARCDSTGALTVYASATSVAPGSLSYASSGSEGNGTDPLFGTANTNSQTLVNGEAVNNVDLSYVSASGRDVSAQFAGTEDASSSVAPCTVYGSVSTL